MTTRITTENITDATIATADIASSVPLNTQWQSVFVGDGSTGLTAVSGRGYFIDTTSGTVTVTLPASPSAGDTITIKDYAETFNTNNVTLARNGELIAGIADDGLLATDKQVTTLVYADNTKGWLAVENEAKTNVSPPLFIEATGGTVVTSGDFKTHIFTGDGCFVVPTIGNGDVNPLGGPSVADYLVVAGGGGAGQSISGGGGGGGFRIYDSSPGTNSPLNAPAALTISATTFPITVGAGGTGGPSSAQGGTSSFSTISSAGGGDSNGYNGTGNAGGSAGGGSAGCSGTRNGGSGNTPPVSPPQGNNGGPSTSSNAGGGGGGAAGAGTTGYCNTVGCGGDGSFIATAFVGPTSPSYGTTGPNGRYFSGGGGGGTRTPENSGNTNSGGLGGAGYSRPGNTGTDGATNTGGGGGGGNYDGAERNGGSGGSGIVMIRYKFQ